MKACIGGHIEKESTFNHEEENCMARRQKSGLSLSNPYVKYGLYALAAYYVYGWYTNMQSNVPQIAPITPKVTTVSAFPNY